METEDNFTDGVFKTRTALTDTTNLPSKRPLSSISGDDGLHNLPKKNRPNNSDDKGKILCIELPSSGNNSSLEPSLPSGGTDDSIDSLALCFRKSERGSQNEGFIYCARERDDDNLGSEKCVALAVGQPPIVSGSKFLGLERCSGLKDQCAANSDASSGNDVGVELLKNCTCSFCSKVGYIWSDLHYQDVKGRLTALRKSQKETRLVVQKVSGINDAHTSIHEQQGAFDPSNLESTLMHQWKSLFVHMETILGHEIKQLESSSERLKDLRENCKSDLELTNNSSSGNN